MAISGAVFAVPQVSSLRGPVTASGPSQLSSRFVDAEPEAPGRPGLWLGACAAFVATLATATCKLSLKPQRRRLTSAAEGKSTGTWTRPPVLVVNLDKSKERWQQCTEEFAKQNVQAERFPATLGKALTEEERMEQATFGARYFCTAGMIGCFMSHLRMWRKVVDEDIPAVVVLEDDVVLYPDFEKKLKVLMEDLPQDWDVCLLGAVGCINQEQEALNMKSYGLLTGGGRPSPGKSRTISEHLFVPYRPAGTHAYLVSRKGAEFLKNQCPKARYHVDLTAWSLTDLKLYCAKDFLATQRFDETDTTVSKGGAPLTKRFLRWAWSIGGFAEMARKAGCENLTWAWKTAVFALPVPFSRSHRRIIVEAGPSSSLWVLMMLACIPLKSLKPAGFAFAYLGTIIFTIRWLAGTQKPLPILSLASLSAACFLAPARLGLPW